MVKKWEPGWEFVPEEELEDYVPPSTPAASSKGGGNMANMPTSDAELAAQLAAAGYSGPLDHDSMVAAWQRANSGGPGTGAPAGPGGQVIAGSDYLAWAGNQAQAQAQAAYLRQRLEEVEKAQVELQRQAQRLNEERFGWDKERWSKEQTWDEDKFGVGQAMDEWQARNAQSMSMGNATGGYAPLQESPNLPYRYRANQFVQGYQFRNPGQNPPNELLDQLFPMLGSTGPGVTQLPQVTAEDQAQVAQMRRQFEQAIGKQISDAQWRTAVTGRLDPADPAVLSGEAKAGQPLTDFTQRAQNPWRIPGLDLLQNLPASYRALQTPAGSAPSPSAAAPPSSAAPSAPPTAAPPQTGWTPPPDFNPPQGWQPPADWGWPSDWEQRAKGGQVSMSGQEPAPAATEGGTMKIQGFPTGQQPWQRGMAGTTLGMNPADRPAVSAAQLTGQQPGSRSYSAAPGQSSGITGRLPSQAQPSYSSSSGPNPYGSDLQVVRDPITGQMTYRGINLRQQDLAEWQAQNQQRYNEAMMQANPANYAVTAALQGKAPWQRGMAQAPGTQQPDMSIQPVSEDPIMRAQGGISSQVGQQQPNLNQRWGVPTPREMNAQQLMRLRPDQRQAFGSAIRATGRSPEDWEQEQRTYTPQRASYAKARW